MLIKSSLGVARFLASVLVFIAFFSTAMQAQTGLPQGSLSGTVTDAAGAVISGARVDISPADGTVVRTATTLTDGTFRIAGLASGSYQLTIAATGFSTNKSIGISVAVGRDTDITVRLAPMQTTEHVVVSAQTAALDITETSPVTNVDRDRIEELPIPSRNYLSFTLLAPSLGSANPSIGASAQSTTGESGFSAGGLRPSSNAVFIDGVEDNDEFTGLSRTELSPEAISDFQVVNHGYAAQSGGSAGGSVDVETRSGANLLHGDAFVFIQNGALNATPALQLVPTKPDENRLRAGLSVGGALKPNRFFYYLAAEQEMAHGEEAGDFNPQLASVIDSALAAAGPLHGVRVQQGFFPTTNQETELSARADRNLAAGSLMLRYAFTNNRAVNNAFNTSELYDASARGSVFYNDNSLNGAWNRTISPRWLVQLSFQAAQRRAVSRTATASGPGVEVAGIIDIGTPYGGNSRRYETHADLSAGVMRQGSNHLLQADAALSHIGLRSAVFDGFGGLYVFPDLAALASAQPDFYIQSFGNENTGFAEERIAAFAQDHWTPMKGLAMDYGVRYEFNRLPAGLPQHPLNLSPRLGVVWSPRKDWAVRGGFGIFMDRYLLGTLNRIREFDGIHALQQIAERAQAASLYQTGIPFASPQAGIAPGIWTAQPQLANPYSETASFGVEHELPSQWTARAEYRFVRGVKMGRTVNINLPPPVVLTSSNAASLGIPAPTPQQLGQLVFPQTRLNGAYDAINQFQTEANSTYNGITVTANRQFTEGFELMAGYTFSKTIDDASNDAGQPQNPYALRGERALSLNHQGHRFVLSGLWVLGPDLDDPKDVGTSDAANPFLKALYGLEFAPIVSVDSGFRDNAITGVDSNREHIYPFAVRPSGFARDTLQTPANIGIDLRILKMIPIWRGHLDVVGESFNLLNRQNVEMNNGVFGSRTNAAASFNTPMQVADSRRVQFSLDYEF
jgi:hypothetical protein